MITLKDFFSFRNNRFFWLNIIGMVVAVIVVVQVVLWRLNVYTHHGEAFEVPDVTNKTLEQAQLLLSQQQLTYMVVDSSYVKGVPSGVILDQTPAQGMRVKEGRVVYLTINTDKVPEIKIPDLVENSSMRQAAAKLQAMGFRLTSPEYVSGEQDWVYGIKYRGRSLMAGDRVPREAELTLCVGSTQVRDSLSVDSFDLELDPEMMSIPSESQTKSTQKSKSEAEVDKSWF